MRGIWNKYYSDANGVIFIIDLADEERFSEINEVLNEVITNPLLEGVPAAILLNKIDKINEIEKYNLTKRLNIEENNNLKNKVYKIFYISSLKWYFQFLFSENLKEPTEWIVEKSGSTERAVTYNL